MGKLKVLFLALMMSILGGNIVMAQDDAITDEDLRKYALLSEVIDFMKKDISVELNKMIKAQEGMTGQRYKELASAKGDDAKMNEMGAKDYEKQFMNLVNNMMDERKEALVSVNSELATKMVGDKGKVYKKIKADLKTDADLKTRYDAILAQVKGE
jgi:hypothetical protein